MDIAQIIMIGSVIILGIAMFGILYILFKMTQNTFKEDVDINTLKKENKDLQESVDQIYEDYQDIGRMYFNLKEKVDSIVFMCTQKYMNTETKKLANEILKILNMHATAIPIKFGTDKNLERLIF